jgi:hypothetical protein
MRACEVGVSDLAETPHQNVLSNPDELHIHNILQLSVDVFEFQFQSELHSLPPVLLVIRPQVLFHHLYQLFLVRSPREFLINLLKLGSHMLLHF